MNRECAIGQTIINIFRKEWAEKEEQPPAITDGALRNERCKINKQVHNRNLEWKYVAGLIEFAMATYDQATIVQRSGEIRRKYINCKKELEELKASMDQKVQEKFNEKLQNDYEKNYHTLMTSEKTELEERVKSQTNLIQKLTKKNESLFQQNEKLKQNPSKESYDQLQSEYFEYVNSQKSLRKSNSTSSLGSNEEDTKYKEKYKKYKEKYEKLELENFKLKKKLQNGSDSSDSSSDEDITEEM